METAEDKLSFLSTARLATLDMESLNPDATQNWLNLTDNDFDSFIPIASKETKGAKTAGQATRGFPDVFLWSRNKP